MSKPSTIKKAPKTTKTKPSGVEWLGDIPEHWEVLPLRAFLELKSERNHPDAPVLSVYREYGVILKDSRDDNHNSTSSDTSNYKVVYPSDLVINKMKAWQGSLGVSQYHGIVSPAYITCKVSPKLNGKYLHYLLRSKPLIGALDSISYGVRIGQWDMRYDDFKKIEICQPPKTEQDKIVVFLDRKTAQIDALIEKKQRLLKLLDEQLAIKINNAVTKGIVNAQYGTLNPHLSTKSTPIYTTHTSPLKKSGIEWIGEIPEEWEVVPLKRNTDLQTGITLGKAYPAARSIELPYLRVANVQNGHVKLKSLKTLVMPKKLVSRYTLNKGDVLVAEGGDLDKLGRGCVWNKELPECLHQNHVFAVRPHLDKLLPEFLSLSLGSNYGQHYFTLTGKKTTNLASTNSNLLMSFPLNLPTEAEQKRIINYITDLKLLIANVQSKTQLEIKTLKNLSNTVIFKALTGNLNK